MASRRARVSSIGLALALTAPACSYWDLGYLQRCGDGGCSEAGSDATSDIPPPPCEINTDAAYDVPTPIPCNTLGMIDLNDVATPYGGSLVVMSDNRAAPNTLRPPDRSFSCPQIYSTDGGTTGERVYRYTVQRGPRVVATTDAPDCPGSTPPITNYDTMVYIRTSCEQDTGAVLDCNDDDEVLAACGEMGSGGESSAVAGGLVPGQVIYIVVDGYGLGPTMGLPDRGAGDFRLTVTENAARNAPPPAAADNVMTVDRCSCAPPEDTSVTTLPFPGGPGDVLMSAGGGADFATAGDEIVGPHRIPFSHISGVALDGLCLERNDLMLSDACQSPEAVVDLLIGGTAVQSFRIVAGSSTAAPISVGYQTFGGLNVPTDRDVAVALRLRAITPAPSCGSVRFRNSPATLTLFGRP